MPNRIVTTFLFFLLAQVSFEQQPANKDALQRQRDKLKNEIAQTEKILNETKKTAKVNIGQLSLINKKMSLQGNVIENINGEIKALQLVTALKNAFTNINLF